MDGSQRAHLRRLIASYIITMTSHHMSQHVSQSLICFSPRAYSKRMQRDNNVNEKNKGRQGTGQSA